MALGLWHKECKAETQKRERDEGPTIPFEGTTPVTGRPPSSWTHLLNFSVLSSSTEVGTKSLTHGLLGNLPSTLAEGGGKFVGGRDR